MGFFDKLDASIDSLSAMLPDNESPEDETTHDEIVPDGLTSKSSRLTKVARIHHKAIMEMTNSKDPTTSRAKVQKLLNEADEILETL